MSETRFGQSLARGVAIACVLGLVIAGGLWWTLKDAGIKRVTAYFPTTVGLYEGNDVRVLGVQMGEVVGIEPMGDKVKVDMEYDRAVQIPANANAVIVAPSLVSDRYVQFAPAYTGGPELANGVSIPMDRTVVPLEVDDLYDSLSEVSKALGPNEANKNGALSDLLDTFAENFEGNGQALNDTITKLSQAAGTLSGNSGDLFKTVENLGQFSTTLANSDGQIRQFEQQLTDVSGFLAGERENLAATVQQLGTSLASVEEFIENNRGRVKSNVDKLASVTRVLVEQRAALAEILDIAPVALGNVANTYNASSGTTDSRSNLNELTQPPIVMICNFLQQTPEALDLIGDACGDIAPLLDGTVPLPSVAQTIQALESGELPPLPLPLAGQVYGTPPSQGGGH
ncbi:MCE family protein [Amycolatopsis palatopharyngis]|uniref:MCE family protein n=1 Tax=Amycolatopsis palatopharyngis TaxID=187982 RepID=UPI000E227222|nr:MCE family protein [Amycolatopsis palatopharyngis]